MVWSGEKAEQEFAKGFSSGKSATRNDVDRGKRSKAIFREFAQQGRQILVFGPTGASKTSMVLDNLAKMKASYQTNSLWLTMTSTTSVESFITAVTFRLKLQREAQSLKPNEDSLSIGESKAISWISARQTKNAQRTTVERYAGIDDFAILEEVLFRRNTMLVVDGMENLSEQADRLRVRLAETAKNMSDDAIKYEDSYAKIVFVGTASTAGQLWHDVESLKSRLATVSVPYPNSMDD